MIKIDDCTISLVGVPEIDCEHIELIILMNLIDKYSKVKDYQYQVPTLAVIFTSKLVSHFRTEEEELRRLNSRYAEEHIIEHKRILDETLEILKDTAAINTNAVQLFEDKLINHLIDYDIRSFKDAL